MPQTELLQKLAANTSRLLSEANKDWLLLHMAAMLKYLYSYRLNPEYTALAPKVFQQLAALQASLCPADISVVGCPLEISSQIQQFYKKALAIAQELKLQTELQNLDLLQAQFLQIPRQPQTTTTPLVPPDDRALIESLNTYCGYLLKAHRAQNQEKISELTKAIDILETRFILKMLEPNTQAPIPLIKNLAVKLYQNQTGNPDFSKGLLQIFTTILERATTPQNLELLAFLSELAFPEVPIDTQYLPDWQRYRAILQAHRTELAKEISPTNILVAQHNFSRNLQKLTRLMLQECFDLLGAPTPPHKLCFLMLGSMSRMDMQPYSDFEYALLEDSTNQEYTEKLLKLFEFKIHSLGEQSLSGPGELPSSGLHLDAEGHPGNTSPFMERFRGTPLELIERCLHYWEQPWTDPDNFCHLQISYSLLQADYLWGACDLWQEYQHQLTSFLTPERRKPLAEKYLQFHSAEFMAENDATTGIKIKDLVIAPLLYLLQDIYLHKTITSTYNHGIVTILENLVTQKIISPDFACDCSRILKLSQFLRYQEQSNVQRQVKPELVANTEELEGALSLIRATHEVTYILSLTRVTTPTETPSITVLNIASLPFDPLLLKLHAFEQLQLSNKPDQASDLCTLHEPAIPDELIILLKNRIWSLVLHQASILKYKEYYVQLPTKTLREIMLGFIENFESQARRQIIWETLARYPNCDGTRPFVEREEEQWLKTLSHLFATNDQDASSAILTLVYMDKGKIGRLHNKVFECLVDRKHKKLKTQSCGGTHLVLPVQIGDDSFHFKFYPENPGYEIAAASLYKLVIGHGASQSVLARLELLGNTYPVLISKTVTGQDLSLVLHNEPDTPLTLDAKFYSQLFLLSLLLQPEDGKPDNYVLQEITIDGKKQYTLVCIDNDHVFAKPMEEASWFSMEQIFTKTIIYCLNQLRSEVHPEAIEEFLLLKPIYLLGSWLKNLQKYAEGWVTLFNQEESEIYTKMPEKKEQSLLRLKLPSGLMGILYQQFCTMQEILASCKKQQISITHYELLKRKNRTLAKFYKKLFTNSKTPKLRFAEIARLYYNKKTAQQSTQEIVRYQSRIDSRQMLSLSFNIRTRVLELVQNGGYNIAFSLQELESIANRYSMLRATIANLESNDEKLIQKELEILKKTTTTEIGVFISRIINRLDFAKVPLNFQKVILKLFANISIDKLLLRSCSALDDSLLLTILAKQPNLRMLQLEGCSNLSIIKLPFLPNLMSIRIKGCANLQSIEMLEKASREPTINRTLAKLTVLEIIDCPKMDILHIPVPTWQLKQQLCFKDHSYYINKYRIMIKELFVHYSKMYIDAMLLNLYREISTSKVIINYELHKKLEQVIKKYLSVLENRVISALIKALHDEYYFVRSNAAIALSDLGNADERVLSPLITALQDKGIDVRGYAAKALGKLGNADERVLSPLITALQDKNKDVRRYGTIALGIMRNNDVVSALIMELQDIDSRVLLIAGLCNYGSHNADECAISLSMALDNKYEFEYVRRYAAKALGNLGNADERILSYLIMRLHHKDVRRYAAEVLGNLDNADERVLSPLITALQDKDCYVRRYAAKTLGNLGNADERVISVLITALQDKDADVRKNVAKALGKLGNADEHVISVLITALQDKDADVRKNVAKALGKLGNADEHVISALIMALQDKDIDVSRCAAAALAKQGNNEESFISALIMELQDKACYVPRYAAKTLGNLGNADERVISALIMALQDKDRDVRKNVAKALGKLGNADERVISALVMASSEKYWPTSRYATIALGNLGNADERVISALIMALHNHDSDTCRNAAKALGKILSPQNGFATQIRQTIAPYIAPEHRPIRFFGNTSKIPAITSYIMHNIFTQLNISTLPLKQQRQFFALSRVSKTWYTLFQHPTLTAQHEATKNLLATQLPMTVAVAAETKPVSEQKPEQTHPINSTQIKTLPINPTTLIPTGTQYLSHPGLQHQTIVGDGNCLYRAITLYLSNGEDIAFLRNMVAANLKHNADDYRDFIPLQEESLQDYIENIRSTRTWAGNVEINILMRLLNRPIVIIGPEGTIRNLDDISRYKEQEPIFVYYNGEDHYDALLLAAGCDGKVILEQLLAPQVTAERSLAPGM